MSIPTVFIGTSYKNNENHAEQIVRAWMRYAIDKGYAPVAPWLQYVRVLDDDNEIDVKTGIAMNMAVIEQCDEYWLVGDVSPNSRAWREMDYAQKHDVPTKEMTATALPLHYGS